MDDLKQSGLITQIIPTEPIRPLVKRERGDQGSQRQTGKKKHNPRKGQQDGHKIDEYA